MNSSINRYAILKMARAYIENCVDMGHFANPKEATPYLVDGFQYGYSQAHKDLQQENAQLKEELSAAKSEIEKLKETISFLPKVPTQPYDKELAQRLDEAVRFLRQCNHNLYFEGAEVLENEIEVFLSSLKPEAEKGE